MARILFLLPLLTIVVAGPFAPVQDGKIVGGQDTTIDQFPYQASLRTYGFHFCGASIYSTRIIITAAHCFDEGYTTNLGVVVGSTYRLDGQTGVPVKKFVMHPLFRSEAWYDYDVAIVLLDEPLQFSETVQPISLAAANKELKAGLRAYVSGWGTLKYGGSSPNQLQYVAVTTIDRTKCGAMYAKIKEPITNRMLCAGEEFGGKDACQGDSGGPLVLENKLVGIVSWGEACAHAAYPGVYADVAVLRGWIEETIEDLMKFV